MAIEVNNISVQGLKVRYYEAGSPHKRTLLLLHGGFGAAELHWARAAEQLADFHVIAPDLPGYGESDPLPNMSIDALVAWVKQLMDALGLDQVVIIGSSFAGLIARLFAVRYARHVEGLVLINGGVIPKINGFAQFVAGLPVIGNALFQRLASRMITREELALAIEDKTLMTDEFLATIHGERVGLGRLMRAMAIMPTPTDIVPHMPTLLLWGEEDAIVPRVVGQRIHEGIPSSRLELIAGVRHMPHVEVPDIFAWQLGRFINTL